MFTARKRVVNRNDRTRRRQAAPSGSAVMMISFIFVCLWLLFMVGFVISYVKNEDAKKGQVAYVQQQLKNVVSKKVAFPAWARRNNPPVAIKKRHTDDEEVESVVPEGGAIHKPNLLPLSEDADAYRSPMLIFTCRRQQYLSQTLDDILSNIGDHCAFGCPVVVSEDGAHDPIRGVIEEYTLKFQEKGIPLIHMQHHQVGTRQNLRGGDPTLAYQALAQHYGWALGEVFDGLDPLLPTPERVIILEEDIHTSPDFFSYMKATSKLLDEDSKLLVISSYNDNGHMVNDPYRILRTDFFPGLGWMMNRRLWKEELESKWPKGYWDDWLREPEQRKGRHILRPEVSRSFHFGEEGGTSGNQFGSILSRVKLNKDNIDWSTQDLSYLREAKFDEQYGQLIAQSAHVRTVNEALESVATRDTRLEYGGLAQFQAMAHKLGIMEDEKAAVPRTSYKGVVEIRPLNNRLLFLTPRLDTLTKSLPTAGGG